MSALNSALFGLLRSGSRKVTSFMHSVVFGHSNLLLTNALISAGMGTIGDSIQQNYDILMHSLKKEKKVTDKDSATTGEEDKVDFSVTRSLHMTMAGLTTGVATHYWYIVLDKYLSARRTPMVLAKKVLIDQIIFSPINLFVYFSTLGICERSNWRHVKNELLEKGFENIYVVEWFIWPPMQLINFALLPLRYRILFDNVISMGFDIYSPYVKYKCELKCEQVPPKTQQT